MATTQEAVQISAIVPTLTVTICRRASPFTSARLCDRRAVGRERDAARRDAAERATQIGLNQDDWKKGRDRNKGIGVRLSISTSTPGSVDEIAKRAKNAGITLKSEPRDTEWKSRAFEVSDPSGFLLTIFSETSA